MTVRAFQPGEKVRVVFPVPRSGLHLERCPIAGHLVKVVSALEQHGADNQDSPWHYTSQVSTNVKDRTIEVVTHLPVGKTREQMVDEVTAAVRSHRSEG